MPKILVVDLKARSCVGGIVVAGVVGLWGKGPNTHDWWSLTGGKGGGGDGGGSFLWCRPCTMAKEGTVVAVDSACCRDCGFGEGGQQWRGRGREVLIKGKEREGFLVVAIVVKRKRERVLMVVEAMAMCLVTCGGSVVLIKLETK